MTKRYTTEGLQRVGQRIGDLAARRHFLQECGVGLGAMALASLARPKLFGSSLGGGMARPGTPVPPHFPARAKRVIYLFMAGAPSHLDLFDHKPALERLAGQPLPESVIGDQRYAFIGKNAEVMASPFSFRRHGDSGASLSEVMPHLAKVADELTIIRSMHTDKFNHAPAQIFMNTGSGIPGRPSMGSWVHYGLGTESEDLPGFVVLSSGGGTSGGVANWSSGFLPSSHEGVAFRSQGDPILNVSNPDGVDGKTQRASVDAINSLNRQRLDLVGDPEIATHINNYELAFRMQASSPELMDFSKESASTLADYGVQSSDEPTFARNCLLARRLLERGVRFINLYHRGWDHHTDVEGGLKQQCGLTDQPIAALISDLRDRGMLDDTLVVWGGEFGRTPMAEANAAIGRVGGRDHHPQAFTMWMAGGGTRPGLTYGATDDLGFHVTENPVHVHDLQATILHLLGLDHERLTFPFKGRDFRLTDVHGRVVTDLIA